MESTFNKSQLITVSGMVALAALTRFLPHPPNFTAIGAMALFGASTLSDKRLAVLVPILAMTLSDLFIPFGFNPSVYFAFIAIVGLGFIIRNRVSFFTVISTSLIASTLFFVVTNLSVWYSSGMYEINAVGLTTCFNAAIPFFPNTIAGDLFYSGLFFGSYALLKKSIPALAR